MEVINATKSLVLAGEARLADSFFTRLRGLLGSKSLPTGAGLVIRPCGSVHTLGMGYAIDVLFADGGNRVLKAVSCLAPGRMAACGGSRYVVELPAGTVAKTGTVPGDTLVIR